MATKEDVSGYPQGYGRLDGIYKTEYCNHFRRGQDCPYGDECNFAHSFWELAPRLVTEKYKTEDCKNDRTECRFGKLCKFRHHNDFCLWLAGNLYLMINRRSGIKLRVLIECPKPAPCASGLLDMAMECSREMSDPDLMCWLQATLSRP